MSTHQPRNPGFLARNGDPRTFLVVLTGIVLSVSACLLVRAWERKEFVNRVEDVAREQIEKLQVDLIRSLEVLYSIASLHAAQGGLDRGQFQRFAKPTLARRPELQALSWNPIVKKEARAQFEAGVEAEGFTGFHLWESNGGKRIPVAADREEYIPVQLIEPIEKNHSALGFDLASDPLRRASVRQALASRMPTATGQIHLVQETLDDAGFLVILPVYLNPVTVFPAAEAPLAGFAVAVYRVSDLVGKSFAELRGKGIESCLFDQSPGGELIYGQAPPSASLAGAGLANSLPLEVASRQWLVRFSPTQSLVDSQSHLRSRETLAIGFAFTLLTGAFVRSVSLRTRDVAATNAALQEEIVIRQRAEAQAAAANQAKSNFLVSMSHEIRTPLNAILGYTQLMRRDRGLSTEQRDSITGISASGQHLLGLINEILDLAKIEAGKMELQCVDFDLATFSRSLASTFQPLCAQKKIGLRLEVRPQDPGRVRADEGKLRQVLINLIGNAVKFTRSGEICVRIHNNPSGRCLFEVMDTGLGISEEEQTQIFEPFHQGSGSQHLGGTGLGLAIARRQVELLGGRLELQSERGIGSRFYFDIPMAEARSQRPESGPEIVGLAAGCRVSALVVDDNEANREILGRMLGRIGCVVAYAVDGREALARIQADPPSIVFLDLLLPDWNGEETARNILAAVPAPPKLVMHTASALSVHRERALEAGCVDFLSKPIDCDKLYECLKVHLGAEFACSEVCEDSCAADVLGDLKLSIPEDLCSRMHLAAELHSTTALRLALQELRQHGDEARMLAEQIRLLMRSFDMDGIARLLARHASPIEKQDALST